MGFKQKIKRRLMLRSMKKQKKEQPFSVRSAESFALSPDLPENFNNSYYLTAHDDGFSCFLRLGQRGDGTSEIWASVRSADAYYVNETTLCLSEQAPLKVECAEVSKRWNHVYKGTLCEAKIENGEAVPSQNRAEAEIRLEFSATAPVYDFFTHGNDALAARAYSRVKWNGEFFEGLKKNKQTHYEQYGVVSGTIRIGGKEFALDKIPAVRDHSFGMRDWGYMNRHIWLAGVSQSGKAFNVSMVSYPIANGLLAGNVFNGDFENFEDFIFSGDTVCGGKGPDGLSCTITLQSGKTMTVEGRRTGETVYELQGGAYILREGYGEFCVNGETYRGIWEFGYNRDRSRWGAL